MKDPISERYPIGMPSPDARNTLFAGFSFHQGKLLAHLRKLKTQVNPEGLYSPALLQPRLDQVRERISGGREGLGLSYERWLQIEKEPVLETSVSLDEWYFICAALGWSFVDVLRWLRVTGQFGELETIGQCIRFERERAGLTQAQLAARIGEGFKQQSIYNLERIKHKTGLDNLELVAKALGISVLRLVPAGQRLSLEHIVLRKVNELSEDHLFSRRKRCRAENPELSWNDMSTELLETLGY
jgi:transcriptional regulator with XRE-family HTH domain